MNEEMNIVRQILFFLLFLSVFAIPAFAQTNDTSNITNTTDTANTTVIPTIVISDVCKGTCKEIMITGEILNITGAWCQNPTEIAIYDRKAKCFRIEDNATISCRCIVDFDPGTRPIGSNLYEQLQENYGGQISRLTKELIDNKNYVYYLIGIVILAGIVYYYKARVSPRLLFKWT